MTKAILRPPGPSRSGGAARKVTEKAFTKQAAASPLVSASTATAATQNIAPLPALLRAPAKIAWKVSHSLINPFSGGRAEMAIEPARKAKAVYGISLMSPPIFSISRAPPGSL